MSATLLEVSDLRTYFHTEEGVVKAVDDLSFRLEQGRTLGIVGESGSGKSVTSLSIMRLLASTARIETGRISFLGKDLVRLPERQMQSIRGRDISMIFQEPMTSLNPVFTVGAQIMEAIILHQKVSKAAARRRRSSCCAKSAFPKPEQRVDSYPHQMSGGQKQRVMIAMALSCNPQLLIADEPTTALDVTIQAQILEILRKLRDNRGMAIIFITHDLGVIAEIADDVLVMFQGEEVEYGPVLEIFANPKHPYTKGPARLPAATRNQIPPAADGRRLHGSRTRACTSSGATGSASAASRVIEKKMDAGAPQASRNRRPRPAVTPQKRTLLDRPPLGRRPSRTRHANNRRRHRAAARGEEPARSISRFVAASWPARSITFARSTTSASTSTAAKRSASWAKAAAVKPPPAAPSFASSSRPAARCCTAAPTSPSSRRANSAQCAAKCRSYFRTRTAVPRKEDRRLVQGQGLFFDDVRRHGMGYVHFVRSPYAHARIQAIDVSAALETPGVYGTLTGDEVAILTDPFFQIAAEPGGSVKDYALAVGKVRYIGEAVVAVVAETRELARDASELVVVDYDPLDVVVDARVALEDGAPVLHEECGGNMSYAGVWEWGDVDAAFAEADHVVKISELHFDRFNSTPLELDGASGGVQPRHGPVGDHHQQPVPRVRCDHDGARHAGRYRQAPHDHPGHRGRLRQQDHVAPAARGPVSARAQAEPAGAVDRMADGLPPVDVPWQRALVPGHRGGGQGRRHHDGVPDEGPRRRGRLPTLRAARRRHLVAGRAGDVRLAQPPRRVHAGDDEQGALLSEPRLLADAAPLVHGTHHRHRRARARVRPRRAAEEELRPARADALRDAQRLRLRLG